MRLSNKGPEMNSNLISHLPQSSNWLNYQKQHGLNPTRAYYNGFFFQEQSVNIPMQKSLNLS